MPFIAFSWLFFANLLFFFYFLVQETGKEKTKERFSIRSEQTFDVIVKQVQRYPVEIVMEAERRELAINFYETRFSVELIKFNGWNLKRKWRKNMSITWRNAKKVRKENYGEGKNSFFFVCVQIISLWK